MDRKSIIITLLMLGGLFTFLYFAIYSETPEPANASNYNLKAKGLVYSIESVEQISQGKTGSKEITLGYTIKYVYNTNEENT